MECDTSVARRDVFRNAMGGSPSLRQLGSTRAVRVDGGAGLPGAAPAAALHRAPRSAQPPPAPAPDAPFMNEMDEITFWVQTKRAPCLLNYDNPIKKQIQAHDAKEPRSVTEETRSPKKKKKRKLSLLDDSVSSEGHQNVYFETQNKTRQSDNRCKSDGSDIEFNLNKTSVREKSKKPKLLTNRSPKVHKKSKMVTSTPKETTHLRRSLRHNKGVNHNLNNSFELFHTSVTNGTHNVTPGKHADRLHQNQVLAVGDQTNNMKPNNVRNRSRPRPQNGHYDDMSDVSGFTANYIRSTKVQSSKTPRNIRSKSGRNLMKESRRADDDSNMVVTMNKSVNTGLPPTPLNCSTDSSQNLLQLVTTKHHHKSIKLDKSTSLLKFVDIKTKGKEKTDERKQANDVNVTFQTQGSRASRYPKRIKTPAVGSATKAPQSSGHRATDKNCVGFNNSDKKENPGTESVSKTRSGRNVCLSLLQKENAVLVVSNSTELVSSQVSLNVASPKATQAGKKKRLTAKQGRPKKATDKVQSPRRESLRDRSGFAACFSESDDDSEPLVQRKYFCP